MQSKKAGIIFAFITILIDMIGIGIIIPVMPDLIRELTGASVSEAATYGGYLMMAFAGMQFLFSPVLGELSDQYGRRPILLIALFCLAIDFILHAVAHTIFWLFVGRVLAGMAGGSITVANAYVADVSTPENKAKNFGLIGAAFGLGFVIGPILGGIFGQFGPRVPFYVAAILGGLNFLFGLLFVPESLAPEKRRKFSVFKMIPGISLVGLSKYAGLGGLIVAFFLANMAGQSLPATWTFFTIEKFNWSPLQIGASLAVVGILVAAVQGGLIGWATKRFGAQKTITFGFVFWTIGMALFAFAEQPWMLYAFLVPYALGGVAGPTLQGLISNQVPDNEQGNLLGSLTALGSITAILGPPLATEVFAHFTEEGAATYFPGAPYITSAILLALATVLAILSLRKLFGQPSLP